MTTVAGQCRMDRSARGAGERLVFAWALSPQAAWGAGLCESPTGVRLEIEAPWPGCAGTLGTRLVTEDGDWRTLPEYSGQSAQWSGDEATSLLHLDVDDLVHATVRVAGNGGVEVLYARTALLGALGIGGGRYDFAGCVTVRGRR